MGAVVKADGSTRGGIGHVRGECGGRGQGSHCCARLLFVVVRPDLAAGSGGTDVAT